MEDTEKFQTEVPREWRGPQVLMGFVVVFRVLFRGFGVLGFRVLLLGC